MRIKRFKQITLKIVLTTELIFCCYVYVCGHNGLLDVYRKRHENTKIEYDIRLLEKQIVCLEQEINAWQSDNFYREKIAREQLQMARCNDEIFYIGS